MRIAIISDIHGNLPALDSVLEEIDRAGVDSTVCLGDVSASGPQPRECLSRLRSRRIPVVMGNKDEIFLEDHETSGLHRNNGQNPKAGDDDEDARRIRDIDNWCRLQLTTDDLAYIRTFKKTISVFSHAEGPSSELLFCFHGSPISNKDLITSKTPDTELDALLSGTKCPTMTSGHSHMRMLRKFEGLTIINPGSVGQAIERTSKSKKVRRVPWSEFATVNIEEKRGATLSKIEFAQKPFDMTELVSVAFKSGMPHAEWWALRE